MFKDRFPVVAALDPPLDVMEVSEWVERKTALLAHLVSGCKLGARVILPLGLREVESLVGNLRRLGCPLMVADLKIADVPHTSRWMARYASKAGFDVVIVHAFAGGDVVAEVAAEGLRVWLVAALSNTGARESMDPLVPYFVRLAEKHRVDGLVLPATMPSLIRLARRLGWDGLVVSPGVGAQGAEPCSAIRNGASHEIVGRSLVQSEDPGRWLKANYGACNTPQGWVG